MAYTGVGLAEYAKTQIGNPYIYGTFGQIGNAKILSEKHSQYPSFVTSKRCDIVRANPDKYYGKPWHDCSGLIKGYLMKKNLTVVYNGKYDLSANRFYSQSPRKGEISSIPEIVGLGVWRNNHIGVYIGNGRCIQAKGFDYGVIESDLSGFTNWCELPFVEYSATVEPIPTPSEPVADVWTGRVATHHLPLNIRANHDINSTILGILPKDSVHKFRGEPVNGWAKLAERSGWCSMEYIERL